MVVHFSGHAGYYTAYQYVTKEDTEVLRSENHPSSVTAPKTLPAIPKCTAKATSRKSDRAARKRLTILEVSSIITSNGIDSKLHLLALAKKRKTDGDSRPVAARTIGQRGNAPQRKSNHTLNLFSQKLPYWHCSLLLLQLCTRYKSLLWTPLCSSLLLTYD